MEKTSILGMLVLFALLLGAINLYQNIALRSELNSLVGGVVANVAQEDSAPQAGVSVDDDAVKGDKNAPVTIIEFSDFQCPFCAKFFFETLPKIEEKYVKTGKVKFVYRDFPLDFHQFAHKASEASECAREQGKFWEYHDKLFENQNSLDIGSLKQYAKELLLDSKKFDDCLDSGRKIAEVDKDFGDGAKYGVSGTPAFFINGAPLVGAQPFEAFDQVIQAKLKKFIKN